MSENLSAISQPWRAQQPYLMDIMSTGNQLYDQSQGNVPPPSQMVDPNANLTNAWQGSIDYSKNQGQGIANQNTAGWGQLMNSMDVANNPLVQQQITQSNNQILQDFNEQGMPAIASDAFGAGQTGSSRQGVAEAYLADRTQKNMGANATAIMGNAYQIGSQNTQAAVAGAPQAYAMGNMANTMQGMVGQNQAAWEQAKLGDQYQQWQYQQQRPWDLASMYQGLVTGNYGGTANT